MTPEQLGHTIGVYIGAGFIGALFGLLPMILSQRQNRVRLGWIGFASTMVGGLILGVFLAIPIATVFSIYIFFTKKTPLDKPIDPKP